MPRVCAGGEVSCTGNRNDEFSPQGYFMVLKVGAQAVGKSVRVQVFDPAFVNVGGECQNTLSSTSGLRNNMNPFANGSNTDSDGRVRYAGGRGTFCTGDQYYGGTDVPTTTAFGIREQTDTQIPTNGAPITACAQTFYGHNTPSANNLRSDNGGYRPDLARVFRQWVDLCTFTPARAGDYYIQVRTNLECGTRTSTGASAGTCGNRQRVYTQSGDDTDERGNGANRFALRAIPLSTADRSAVSISGYANFPIYANANTRVAEFPLVRILPGARGKTLSFTFFDPGDGVSNGRVRIIPPTDSVTVNASTGATSPLTTFTGCTGEERAAGNVNAATCEASGIGGTATPTWQGQFGTVKIPVPDTYDCGTVVGGNRVYGSADCWVRVSLDYPGGTVTDATTWTVKLDGDPVRLTE
jgi:hypothetical protein